MPFNKKLYPFLDKAFPENPLVFKKLNKKAIIYHTTRNKRGLTDRIRRVSQSIIKLKSYHTNYPGGNTEKWSPHSRFDFYKKPALPGKKNSESIREACSGSRMSLTFQSGGKRSYNKDIKPEVLQQEDQWFAREPNKGIIPGKPIPPIGQKIHPSLRMKSLLKVKPVQSPVKHAFSFQQLHAEFDKRQSKSSLFKKALLERKKCTLCYVYSSLNRKDLHSYALESFKCDGNWDENWIKIVESRLDVVLVRICFFPTAREAKQWITHKHIYVNSKVVTKAGYRLKKGDIIQVCPKKQSVLKRQIASFITSSIKVRSRHSYSRLDTLYTVVKTYIQSQTLKWFPFVPNRNPVGVSYGSLVNKWLLPISPSCDIRSLLNIYLSMVLPRWRKHIYTILLSFKKRKETDQRMPSSKLVSLISLLPRVYKDFLFRLPWEIIQGRDNPKLSIKPSPKTRSAIDEAALFKNKSDLPYMYEYDKKGPIFSLFFDSQYKAKKIPAVFYRIVDIWSFLHAGIKDTTREKLIKIQPLLSFLQIKNLFTKAIPPKQIIDRLRISGIKPLNIEVCYKNMVAIFLYSPQKVALPAAIDFYCIAKSFQKR